MVLSCHCQPPVSREVLDSGPSSQGCGGATESRMAWMLLVCSCFSELEVLSNLSSGHLGARVRCSRRCPDLVAGSRKSMQCSPLVLYVRRSSIPPESVLFSLDESESWDCWIVSRCLHTRYCSFLLASAGRTPETWQCPPPSSGRSWSRRSPGAL